VGIEAAVYSPFESDEDAGEAGFRLLHGDGDAGEHGARGIRHGADDGARHGLGRGRPRRTERREDHQTGGEELS